MTQTNGTDRLPPQVFAAAGLSFALGLTFIFVRAPHPWGWEGFDNYRALALGLVRGEGFPTIEVPWGYPAFLAFFYTVFGDRQWVPLVVQAFLNALIPLMLYRLTVRDFGRRVALLASGLVALASFNTVYASTQTSDCLCTVLIVAAVVLFDRGLESRSVPPFVAAGLLSGLALQFRPHFLLFPAWVVAAAWLLRRPGLSWWQPTVCLIAASVVWAPWVVRNYRLSHRFIPATTHGGVQLWYGSLQAGPYFDRWFDNPRAVFDRTVFEVSEPGPNPLVVTAEPNTYFECANRVPRSVALTYWTDGDASPVLLPPQTPDQRRATFTIPPLPAGSVLYYFFDASWTSADGRLFQQRTPPAGARDPLVHFISRDVFTDLDRHHDLLDVFDVVRMIRHISWKEPLPNAAQLDFDANGVVNDRDLDTAMSILLAVDGQVVVRESGPLTVLQSLAITPDGASAVFHGGSALTVPRRSSGRLQDLDFRGEAATLIRNRRSFASLALTPVDEPALATVRQCAVLDAGVDRIFYRSEPHKQEVYVAAAVENIRGSPVAFAAAVARRVAGLFIVAGSADRMRAHQFPGSSVVYATAAVLSGSYLALAIVGVVLAYRRGIEIRLLLAVIAYVPVMMCAFLANMRYSVTAQPFVFPFVATTIVAGYERWKGRS